MNRISVIEAGKHFEDLIERVTRQGLTVELVRDDQIVARLSPVRPRLQASDLPRFFAGLPSLGDDAESFARDLERIRQELPRESDPWA
jgi:antitoxin (DNA-binding transcriptional repressor) of toxin-antitoxin stability system